MTGVKEFLVDRVDQWPGVHSARALIDGEPLRGWWLNGTRAYAARRRGERPSRYECGNEEVLTFDPLPCWRTAINSRRLGGRGRPRG